jgi:2-C-methyl-D-erythritol 2,4-cyclodiphosphate synthase
VGELRTGCGFDVHALVEGRPCIIGGVSIPFEKGLAGHSDADLLIHAVIDALLGASGLGDIGIIFPDTDAAYKGISSIVLLERTAALLKEKKVRIVNIDTVVACERPRIAPHAQAMRDTMARALDIDPSRIGVKGKTTEKLGFTGRGEGIASWATALVELMEF